MYDKLPPLLTAEEACEFLRVTPLSLYGYIKGGKLKAFRVGKRYRIPKEALIAFLEGAHVAVPADTPEPEAEKPMAEPPDRVAARMKEIFGKK